MAGRWLRGSRASLRRERRQRPEKKEWERLTYLKMERSELRRNELRRLIYPNVRRSEKKMI